MRKIENQELAAVSGGNPIAFAAVIIAAATYGYNRGKNQAERDNRSAR